MKSLLNQMSSESVALLIEEQLKYPATISNLMNVLETKYFWSELSYMELIPLTSALGKYDYSPLAISSLFTNK